MKALIDGDVIRYSCGFAAEGEDVSHALYNAKKYIKDILEATGSDDYAIFLTGKGNFREYIATIKEYKGNRPDRKPEHYGAISDYLINTWKAEVVDDMEADDAMSIVQYSYWNLQRPETIICTIDKDLDMVPGWHYNPKTEEKYLTGKWGGLDLDRSGSKPKCRGAGLMFFYAQMLMGDTVDNIQGCPRVGDVKAFDLLKDCHSEEEMFCVVGKQYAYKYDDPEAALLENGRLLWMLEEEGKMWEFPE